MDAVSRESLMDALSIQDILFYLFGGMALACALGVILFRNPIYSAFSLCLVMLSVGGLFYSLSAFFVAGVQIIVYAGAVMVLFVMVLMLFNLRDEYAIFSKGLISGALKLISVGLFLGLVSGAVQLSTQTHFQPLSYTPSTATDATKSLAHLLFTEYLFGFELIGGLLLVIAIGAVTLSRIPGGTHAE